MVVYPGRRQITWSRGEETGTCSPFSRNQSSVCLAEPSSKNLLNTSNTRSCTRRSGSFSRPGRRRDDQFATFCFLAARLHRALSQQVQFIFVQTAFQSQQQAIVALSRRVHHFLIDQ